MEGKDPGFGNAALCSRLLEGFFASYLHRDVPPQISDADVGKEHLGSNSHFRSLHSTPFHMPPTQPSTLTGRQRMREKAERSLGPPDMNVSFNTAERRGLFGQGLFNYGKGGPPSPGQTNKGRD